MTEKEYQELGDLLGKLEQAVYNDTDHYEEHGRELALKAINEVLEVTDVMVSSPKPLAPQQRAGLRRRSPMRYPWPKV